jgi:hypothetical protein
LEGKPGFFCPVKDLKTALKGPFYRVCGAPADLQRLNTKKKELKNPAGQITALL